MSSLVETKCNQAVTQKYTEHKTDMKLKVVNKLNPCSYTVNPSKDTEPYSGGRYVSAEKALPSIPSTSPN